MTNNFVKFELFRELSTIYNAPLELISLSKIIDIPSITKSVPKRSQKVDDLKNVENPCFFK